MRVDTPSRKHIEEDFKQFVFALESIAEGVDIATPDNQIRYVNSACARMFGYTKEELIGQPVTVIIPPGEVLIDDDMILADPDEKWEGEVERIRKGGERFFSHLTFTLIRDENQEVIGRMVVHRDITARKLAEQALRESEAEARRLAG